MRVECIIEETTKLNKKKEPVYGIKITCTRCGHKREAIGNKQSAIKHNLGLMPKECPKKEDNRYVDEERLHQA